jgi:hypothetical protein
MRGQGDDVTWWVVPWLVFSLAVCALVAVYLVLSGGKGGAD